MARSQSARPATTAAVLLLLGLCPPAGASTGSRFRGAGAGGRDRAVEAREVEFSLRSSLEVLLAGGQGAAARRLAGIEESLWRTFRALPKNPAGRLAPRAVRYLVHGYFAKEHGWLIKGLEPHGMQANVTEVHEMSILQDHAPALVELLLEARQSDRGLSLEDVVAMVAALERLIFDESLKLLETAYFLNHLSVEDAAVEEELHEILRSYLVIYQMGGRGNLSDARKHQAIKRKLAQVGGSWQTLVEFEEDAVRNYGFSHMHHANPFVAPSYTFETASHLVEDLAQNFGKWQNMECRQMKEQLVKLDVDGDGRVPVSSFYAQPETADYQFSESLDYLRTIGALDETVSDSPRVRIANYMLGPSNCIASSSYYAVCCLSDCEALMNELEGKVQAPTAPASHLLELTANLTATSYAPEAPRQLSQELRDKMHAIAGRHGGEVPLHGRLFAQWLHAAFPRECPYPHVHETAAVLLPGHWGSGGSIKAPKEERQRHVDRAPAEEETEAHEAADLQPQALEWSEDEVLPLAEPPRQGRGALADAARLAVQLTLLLAVLRAAYSGLWAVAGASGGDSEKGGLALPLHI